MQVFNVGLLLNTVLVANKRGIELTSRSRPLKPSDLKAFDLLVAMDNANVNEMTTAIEYWSKKDASLAQTVSKIVLMTNFCQEDAFKKYRHVPDPYYGGQRGFELVLDLLTDACEGLLNALVTS